MLCRQISFLKDLATMRNPASSYSFVSYLHAHGRLATFVNLSTFTPSRVEFSDYLAWCAERVEDSCAVHYGERVDRVEPIQSRRDGPYDLVRVHSTRLADGSTTMRTARNLLVSTGGKPQMPPFMRPLAAPGSAVADVVLHTAEYLERIDGVLDGILSSRTSLSAKLGFSLPPSPPSSDHGSQASPADSPPAIEVGQLDLSATTAAPRPIRIAVIGAGQSAAETFADVRLRLAERIAALPSVPRGGRPQIDMLIRHGALRPSDDSAFSNEVFDPASTDLIHSVGTSAPSNLSGRVGLGGAAALRRGDKEATVTPEARKRIMAEAKATNYSVANPRNIEAVRSRSAMTWLTLAALRHHVRAARRGRPRRDIARTPPRRPDRPGSAPADPALARDRVGQGPGRRRPAADAAQAARPGRGRPLRRRHRRDRLRPPVLAQHPLRLRRLEPARRLRPRHGGGPQCRAVRWRSFGLC